MNKPNPFIDQEDYFEGYRESIAKLKNKPEAIEFDRLCYAVFENRNGRELMQELEERYLLPALAARGSKTYADDLMFFEGFKDAFRHLKICIHSHKQRIAMELQQDDR